MNNLFAAAVEIQEFVQSRTWPYAVIGGIALARWAEPRTTLDVDLSLLTGFGNEEVFIEPLLTSFKSRVPNAKEFALQNRVLLLESANGIGLDIALGGLPFEQRMVARSTDYDFGEGCTLRTVSAEDMVILKTFAGRSKDWADVENILIRQGETLQWDMIIEELAPLCELKESPESVDRLIELRKRCREE